MTNYRAYLTTGCLTEWPSDNRTVWLPDLLTAFFFVFNYLSVCLSVRPTFRPTELLTEGLACRLTDCLITLINWSIDCLLTWTEPPVFTKELSDISINEGETVSFEVGIENDSNCHLEWLKNGVKVTEGERFSLVNHGEGGYSLTIRDTQDDDSGEYHCVAENEAGRVTCGGKLSIECK